MSKTSPCHPPEWASHSALWTAWPADSAIWQEDLDGAREEVAALVKALSAKGPDGRAGDRVRVLAASVEAETSARKALGPDIDVVRAAYGDIWLRDTGPIFRSATTASAFRFNGWGGKYNLPGDADLSQRLAAIAEVSLQTHDFVLEGGAVEMDGQGALITTRECLLNPNRNPGWTQADAERALNEALGAEHVIWLERGLKNDHTDGHVDNLARFVGPGRVVAQSPSGSNDPNADALQEIAEALGAATDAAGRRLDVTLIPSPGWVEDEKGAPMPASHMNFVIGNASVVIPTYGTTSADDAVASLQSVLPDRRVIGLPARRLLTGGGAFHCITQQQPI